MTLQILSGGELVYEPWPWAGDWHIFSGNVDDFRMPDRGLLDPDTLWRTQRNVRTVVGFLARNFAQVRLLAYRRDDEDGRVRLDADEPLARTLHEPDLTVTEFDFSSTLTRDLAMWERWAALKVGDDDGRVRLRRLPPRKWRFIRDGFDQPTAIRVKDQRDKPTGEYVEIDLDRFVWLDGYPCAAGVTTSPMEYLVDLLTEEGESARHRVDMWRNGARISGVIERPEAAPEWTPTERNKFSAAWRAAYGRGGTRAGGTPILEDGMKYVQTKAMTPEQAQQIEARKLSLAEVASAFYVAPELVGAREGTYSNVQAYRQILYSDTLGPMFMQSKQAFDARLVPDFADPAEVYVEHNVAEKLRLSFEEQATVLSSSVGAPYLLRNEARQRMNLPGVAGGDELVTPLNVLIGGQASPADSRPDLRSVVVELPSKEGSR